MGAQPAMTRNSTDSNAVFVFAPTAPRAISSYSSDCFSALSGSFILDDAVDSVITGPACQPQCIPAATTSAPSLLSPRPKTQFCDPLFVLVRRAFHSLLLFYVKGEKRHGPTSTPPTFPASQLDHISQGYLASLVLTSEWGFRLLVGKDRVTGLRSSRAMGGSIKVLLTPNRHGQSYCPELLCKIHKEGRLEYLFLLFKQSVRSIMSFPL